jgi:TPR repeat protein
MNCLQKLKFKRLQKNLHKSHRLYEQGASDSKLKALSDAFYRMAEFYEKQHSSGSVRRLPNAEFHALECYRVLSSFDDPKAQYLLGERLLNYAKFWEELARNPLYKTNRPKTYAESFFEESRVYLQAADEQHYPPARRLLGLIHIHGWGCAVDIQKGYQLVLESIDLEQAWDKATQIFDTLKLNSPEFFAALRAYKG